MFKKIKSFLLRLLLILLAAGSLLVIYLDSLVKDEFKQRAWSIPAKVFARPLEFSEGKKLSLAALKAELKLLGYRQTIKAINPGEYEEYTDQSGKTSFVINTRRFKFWDGMQPEQVLEVSIKKDVITQLKDFASQKEVNFLRLDPLTLGSIRAASSGFGDEEDRQLISLKQLPEYFVATLLNTEDREFFQHFGISLKGIVRAAWSNISQGGFKQGGSTITQQLMKNHFLTNERSLWRKLREAIMAVLTEFHYSKETILQAYINEIYLGQNHQVSIHGFARASEFYFDKPLEDLNLSQVALLIGMVKGPSYYDPRRNPEKAKQRRDLVLQSMLDSGLITDEDYQYALSSTLQVVSKPKQRVSNVPAFIGYVKRELRSEYSLSELNEKGLRLFTSLDPIVQKQAEQSLHKQLEEFERQNKVANKDLQGAIIVSNHSSGDILAMVGDRQANFAGFNRAIDAYRQTGSVIKPFVYLAALKQSERFNLLTPLLDQPFELKGSDGSIWTPENYDQRSHGEVQLQQALIHSYNQASAKLALEIGIENVVETIRQTGFERELEAYPSLALGAKEMSVLEVSRLYQAIANNGIAIPPSALIAVQDHQGQLLQRYPRKAETNIEPELAFLVKYLLTQVVKEGTAKQLGEAFPRKQYAGKTGTTNDLRDSWYAGFGQDLLAVIWLGKDDNQPTDLTGASGALKVWQQLFKHLDEPGVALKLPSGLVWGYQTGGFFSMFSNCQEKPRVPFFIEQLPKDYQICE